MPTDFSRKVGLTAIGFGVAAYLVLDVYSQPRASYRHIEPVRTFLRHALAGDSAALAAEAGNQPIQWVNMAIHLDSAAVREWANSRPRVTSTHRGDTLWVILRRPGSTEHCSPHYPLTAGFLEQGGKLRLRHLSSACPSDSRSRAMKPREMQ
jgi:hypothetical protein